MRLHWIGTKGFQGYHSRVLKWDSRMAICRFLRRRETAFGIHRSGLGDPSSPRFTTLRQSLTSSSWNTTRTFDVVFTSYGVLTWLPDLDVDPYVYES